MKAMWDCESQLWVPGRSRVHGRPYLSVCPITLQYFSFRSWWLCRWMPIWKRSRLVPFLSGWGHRKGVYGEGGGRTGGVQPKNHTCLYNFFSGASCSDLAKSWFSGEQAPAAIPHYSKRQAAPLWPSCTPEVHGSPSGSSLFPTCLVPHVPTHLTSCLASSATWSIMRSILRVNSARFVICTMKETRCRDNFVIEVTYLREEKRTERIAGRSAAIPFLFVT